MLAGVAGYVNALGWATSNVFPGVMSGNTILLCLAIDQRFRASATLAAFAIVGFAGGRTLAHRLDRTLPSQGALLLAALFTLAAALLATVGGARGGDFAVFAASVAMGAQGVVGPTFVSGMLTGAVDGLTTDGVIWLAYACGAGALGAVHLAPALVHIAWFLPPIMLVAIATRTSANLPT